MGLGSTRPSASRPARSATSAGCRGSSARACACWPTDSRWSSRKRRARSTSSLAEEAFEIAAGRIEPGTIAGQRFRWAGRAGAVQNRIVLRGRLSRRTRSVAPDWAAPGCTVEIEGRPRLEAGARRGVDLERAGGHGHARRARRPARVSGRAGRADLPGPAADRGATRLPRRARREVTSAPRRAPKHREAASSWRGPRAISGSTWSARSSSAATGCARSRAARSGSPPPGPSARRGSRRTRSTTSSSARPRGPRPWRASWTTPSTSSSAASGSRASATA